MKAATTPDAQMRALKEWAIERMTTGTQTPWAWFQFMKLLEVLDTFLDADEEAGLHERRPAPPSSKRPAPRSKSMPSNVVPIDQAMRQRAAE